MPMKFIPAQGTDSVMYEAGYLDESWDTGSFSAHGQRASIERMPSYVLEPDGPAVPLPRGNSIDVSELIFTSPATGEPLNFEDFNNEYLGLDGLCVAHHGQVVSELYFNGLTEQDQHLIHSCSKTLTGMQVALAQQSGLLTVDQHVTHFLPELKTIDAWKDVTIQHLLDMATGIVSDENYYDPTSMYYRYAYGVGYWGPKSDTGIGTLQFVLNNLQEQECRPGTKFNYASYNTNLIPLILDKVYSESCVQHYETDIFSKLGSENNAYLNCDALGNPIVEGHLNLTLRDFYRWGHLLLSNGVNLRGEQVIPESWVNETFSHSRPRAAAFGNSAHADVFPGAQYHNQLWQIQPELQRGSMLGIYGQSYYIDRVNAIEIVCLASNPEMTSDKNTVGKLELWRAISQYFGVI